MASKSSSSSTPHVAANAPLTQEEFNIFHNIDRTLFSRLVFYLERDPGESMQVMALLMLLEQSYSKVPNLVDYLLTLPAAIINDIADESVLCLNCIESDEFPFTLENRSDESVIPLIQRMTKPGVSLKFFHENRLAIIRGVTRNVNEVCARAFQDILGKAESMKNIIKADQENVEQINLMKKQLSQFGPVISPVFPPLNHYYHNYYNNIKNNPAAGTGFYGVGINNLRGNYYGYPYDLASQKKILSDEIGEALSHVKISDNEEDDHQKKDQVPADDRTIFLTFSKGYPISEDEVRQFFTRKFGECIETIYMQEVPEEEQPLYARLVLPSPSTIGVFLEGKNRTKFTINGKHVWARKYVRKHPKSPPQPSSSPSQPASPAAE